MQLFYNPLKKPNKQFRSYRQVDAYRQNPQRSVWSDLQACDQTDDSHWNCSLRGDNRSKRRIVKADLGLKTEKSTRNEILRPTFYLEDIVLKASQLLNKLNKDPSKVNYFMDCCTIESVFMLLALVFRQVPETQSSHQKCDSQKKVIADRVNQLVKQRDQLQSQFNQVRNQLHEVQSLFLKSNSQIILLEDSLYQANQNRALCENQISNCKTKLKQTESRLQSAQIELVESGKAHAHQIVQMQRLYEMATNLLGQNDLELTEKELKLHELELQINLLIRHNLRMERNAEEGKQPYSSIQPDCGRSMRMACVLLQQQAQQENLQTMRIDQLLDQTARQKAQITLLDSQRERLEQQNSDQSRLLKEQQTFYEERIDALVEELIKKK